MRPAWTIFDSVLIFVVPTPVKGYARVDICGGWGGGVGGWGGVG